MFKFNTLIKFITFILFTSNCLAKESEHVGMPQMSIPDFMPQLVWLCIIFPIIYLSMKYIALPRISQIINNRELKISGNLTKAEEIKDKIEQTNKDYEIAIEKTNEKIKNIVNEIRTNTLLKAEKKLTDCQSEINTQLNKEKDKTIKEIAQFDKNINKISVEIIENIIEKIYNQKPKKNIIKLKVDKYLESHKNE
tara:strand:- start:6825 stop:7409 length:585 start_codon:yes stop_codon:yes gene_type:complete